MRPHSIATSVVRAFVLAVVFPVLVSTVASASVSDDPEPIGGSGFAIGHTEEPSGRGIDDGPDPFCGAISDGPDPIHGIITEGPDPFSGVISDGPDPISGVISDDPDPFGRSIGDDPDPIHGIVGGREVTVILLVVGSNNEDPEPIRGDFVRLPGPVEITEGPDPFFLGVGDGPDPVDPFLLCVLGPELNCIWVVLPD